MEPKAVIPDLKAEETRFTNLKGNKNVLILSMSILPFRKAASYYCFQEKTASEILYQIYTGESQLEAGTKLFLSRLALEGLKPDRIIILTTDKTWEKKPNYEQRCAVDVYAGNVLSYIRRGGEKEDLAEYYDALRDKMDNLWPGHAKKLETGNQLKELYRNGEPSSEAPEFHGSELDELRQYLDVRTIDLGEGALWEIMQSLNELASQGHVNLFMDLQGGSRSFMFTMFATITLLRDKNVEIKDMFAINYANENKISPIESVYSEYAILDLVSGIRAFTRYGKVDGLKRFLNTRGIREGNEKKLLEIMEDIDGNMQINNPQGFSDELAKLKTPDDAMLDPDTYGDRQFKLIVEDLREAYAPLLVDSSTVLDQIKWFGEKAFLTSALTFIEDKVPGIIVNNHNNPVISAIYDDSLTDDQISKKCGGQSYYRPENNLFNFGFAQIVQNAQAAVFRDISLYLAERIVHVLGSSTGPVVLASGWADNSIQDFAQQDSEFRDCLLKLESNLQSVIWNDIKLAKLAEWASENTWVEFKQQYAIVRSKTNTVKDEELDYDRILQMFTDPDRETQGRISAAASYMTRTHSYNITDDIRYLLKVFAARALYRIFFDEKDAKNKQYVSIINEFLIPLLRDHIGILNNTMAVFRDNEVRFVDSNGKNLKPYGRKHFEYEVWEKIMLLADNGLTHEVLMNRAVPFVSTEDDISRLENDLSGMLEKVKDESSTAELVKYAELYYRCRGAKDSLKKDDGVSYRDARCSYRNLELYRKLGAEYVNMCRNHLYTTGDNALLQTIAGIANGTYNDWLTVDMGNMSEEKRKLLNTCILFYQAFKSERNSTNHAEETGSNHMYYEHTRKAIIVFVELCKRLAVMQ